MWREVVEEKVLVDGMWRDDVYQLESVLVKLSLDVLPHTHIDRIVPILHLVVLTIRFSIYCYLLCQKAYSAVVIRKRNTLVTRLNNYNFV